MTIRVIATFGNLDIQGDLLEYSAANDYAVIRDTSGTIVHLKPDSIYAVESNLTPPPTDYAPIHTKRSGLVVECLRTVETHQHSNPPF